MMGRIDYIEKEIVLGQCAGRLYEFLNPGTDSWRGHGKTVPNVGIARVEERNSVKE